MTFCTLKSPLICILVTLHFACPLRVADGETHKAPYNVFHFDFGFGGFTR
jgi:hypothetical protein